MQDEAEGGFTTPVAGEGTTRSPGQAQASPAPRSTTAPQRNPGRVQQDADSQQGQQQQGPSAEEVKEVKKLLSSWREADFPKLVYSSNTYKPSIFEEWLVRFQRTVAASHSLVWTAFNFAKTEAERAYQVFLNTTSARRVTLRPNS